MDGHRADAVRILDFAHAAAYLHEIETIALNTAVTLPPTWASQRMHDLKQEGPADVLKQVRRLSEVAPSDEMAEKQAALARASQRLQHIFWRFPLSFILAAFPSPPPLPTVPKGRTEGQKRWGRQMFSRRALHNGRYAKNDPVGKRDSSQSKQAVKIEGRRSM